MNNREEDLEYILGELRDAWEIVVGTGFKIERFAKDNGIPHEDLMHTITDISLKLTSIAVSLETEFGEEDK